MRGTAIWFKIFCPITKIRIALISKPHEESFMKLVMIDVTHFYVCGRIKLSEKGVNEFD